MFGKKKMKVVVEMIPTEGKFTTKEVEVSADATVEEALKAAGIDPKNKNFEVDGKVVKPDDKIVDQRRKPVVTAREKGEYAIPPPPRVAATERVSGS